MLYFLLDYHYNIHSSLPFMPENTPNNVTFNVQNKNLLLIPTVINILST